MSDKQAVLLIHGIGEQRPMQTLRGFVEAVWVENREAHHPHVEASYWSKPDEVSESFELRRLTTTKGRGGLRTDFFEFYWAHMIQGTTLGHVWSWARTLLFRDPRSVPEPLRGIWLTLVALLAVGAFFLVNAALPGDGRIVEIPSVVSGLLGLAVLPAMRGLLRRVVGDAARYLDPAPPNIQSRHRIRRAGVELLKQLHGRGYERIVVVGHSLGSVIGYDILKHAWMDYHELASRPEPGNDALDELEDLAASEPVNGEAYRKQQGPYAAELRGHGNPWRVTDFVTLGSPLGHASVLLARDAADLARRQADRELPTCPPALERERRDHRERKRFSFELRKTEGERSCRVRVPHHAAVFAPTRWTNLYFPARRVLWGDPIAGPLATVFGPGVHDVPVETSIRSGLLAHTLYWATSAEGDDAHVNALREALALGEPPPAGPEGGGA